MVLSATSSATEPLLLHHGCRSCCGDSVTANHTRVLPEAPALTPGAGYRSTAGTGSTARTRPGSDPPARRPGGYRFAVL